MSDTNIVFPPNSTSDPKFSRHEGIITPAQLKTDYLFGVDFTDSSGNSLPDRVFDKYILDAISAFEHKFNLTVTPTTFTDEAHDYNAQDYYNYGFTQLYHRPIITSSTITVKIEYIEDETLQTLPTSWIRAYSEAGQLHITPTTGALESFQLDGSGFLPRILGVKQSYPQLLKVTYTAGFEQDKVPHIVNDWIGLSAALGLLNIAGDLILGAGIAQQSISLDGLSQSISSTSSATNSGYGARIIQYEKEIKEKGEIISKYYGSKLRLFVS